MFYIKEWNIDIEKILTLDELCIVIKNNRNLLSVLSNNFLSNVECVLAAMNNEVSNIKFADDLLKKDSEFALTVLKLYGEALEYLDESIKDNKEIVLEAIKNNYAAFEYSSESIRRDEEFICEVYKLNHNIMHFIDDKTIKQSKRLKDLYNDYKSREEDEDDLPF